MKKRLLSVFLCLCMVFGLVPATVWAETTNGHTHYICGGSTCNGSGHENETYKTTFEKEIKQEGNTLKIGGESWTPTKGSNDTFYILPTGTYYLGSDISPEYTIKIENNVTLCLNGHKITAADGMDAIYMTGGSFTLTDCKGVGTITHASSKTGRGVYVSSGTFNMYGGSITGNKAQDAKGRGGGVYVYSGSGTFNMYGGSITGNRATGDGGGVYKSGSNSSFNMYGGSITGNTANSYGGGVYVDGGGFTMSGGTIGGTKTGETNTATYGGGGVYAKANFEMTGGSITGNNAAYGGGVCVSKNGSFEMSGSSCITNNKADSYGGGVNINYASATFTMKGGSITGNNAYKSDYISTFGGGVCVGSGIFTVSGEVTVTDNTKGGTKGADGKFTGDTKNNVYLSTGKTITIGTDKLSEGAQLGVTLANNYGDNAFTSGWKTNMSVKTPTDYFTSDVDGYEAKLYDTELKLVSTHVHSWTYTANGDKITATCKNCEDNNGQDFVGGTCTITAADATYDGSIKTAAVSGTGILENVDMSISYSKYNATSEQFESTNNLPAGAGKYMVSITYGGVTAGVEYTIGKATREAPEGLTVSPAGSIGGKGKINGTTAGTYNEVKAMEYNTSATATTGWKDCLDSRTEVAPGTYYVRYKETDNYYASAVSAALTVKEHTHSGGNATCQKKAVCDGCGQEYGELGNHIFTETVDGKYLVSAATCGSKAVYNKSCSVCGVKSNETFETGEFDYTNHIGSTYKKNQKEATCYAEGYTGDIYCSTCNHEIEKGSPIAKNAHNPASIWTTDETNHWKECQTVGCGNIIDKAHHSGGEATCVKKAICSVCKVEYGAVDLSNHKHTEVRNAKSATCCEKGYTGDTYCTDCNALVSIGAEIPATGNHTDADGKWETDGTNHWHTCYFGTKFDLTAHSGGEATCISKANCSVCGIEYGNVDASNHKHTEVRNAKNATCCEKGYTGDTWCIDCNKIIENGSEIAATGNHTDADGKWETDGTNHWHTCYFGTKFDVAVHSGGEAACVGKAVCEICKAQYGDIDATNHKHTEIRNAKPTTEQEKGYTGDTWCTDCNKKIADGKETDLLSHSLKKVEAKAATTKENGNIEYFYCTGCGKYFAYEDGTKEISLSETVIKKLPPEIIEGNNAIVNNEEKKSLTFRSNATFADFIRVELDGKNLDEKYYTKAEGSIIVTLNNDFVSTLSVGEHTLGIVSESGTATAKFTVKASEIPNESPKTGDNNMAAFWSLAAILSLAVLGFTTVVSKKKRAK